MSSAAAAPPVYLPHGAQTDLVTTVLSHDAAVHSAALGTVPAQPPAHLGLAPRRTRAFTVIVSAPNHMIGDKAQVEAFFNPKKKKAEGLSLPPWYAEWYDLLGHGADPWHLEILETPYDVGRFYRGARLNPRQPRVGFISNSRLSLSCGKRVGGEIRTSGFAELRAARMPEVDEQEATAFFAARRLRRAEKRVEDDHAAADEAEEAAPTTAALPGVSPRTSARDQMLIPKRSLARYVHHQLPNDSLPAHHQPPAVYHTDPMIRAGVCCPTCGRRHLTRSGRPSSALSLKKEGLAKASCIWCDTPMGQDAREQDSVLDRKIALFQSPAWQTRPPLHQRVVPVTNYVACSTPTRTDPCRWFGNRKPQLEAFPLTEIVVDGQEPVLDSAGNPELYRDAEGQPVLGDDGQPIQIVRVLKREIPLLDEQGQPRMGYRPVVAFTTQEVEAIPWGERPQSNPRYALGLLIAREHEDATDLYVADEVHECKGRSTAIGRAFGAMVTACRRTLGLTGTLFGGYASDVYALLLRIGNPTVLNEYGWDAQARFVREAGITDEQTKEMQRIDEAGHFSGEPSISTEVVERPGITAYLASIIQSCSIQILLKHMGFHLVDYDEDLVLLDMPPDIRSCYGMLEGAGKEIISFGGHDALSSYLQATLQYPYAPWNAKTIKSKRKKKEFTPIAFPRDRVLPHHEWLAEYAATQTRKGRRVLIYCEHTGTDDIMPDVAEKITRLAAEQYGATLKVAILRSTTVKSGARQSWFKMREADGTNVVICNPRLVKTGLNLIGWPSIVVLEPVYSLYILFQAKRRAYRPTQTLPCSVKYVAYNKTMSQRAVKIIARKSAAAAVLSGDDITAMMEFDPSMSLLEELSRAVTSEHGDGMNDDIRELLRQGARALKADMESGLDGLVGVDLPTVVSAQAEIAAEALAATIAAGVAGQLGDMGLAHDENGQPLVLSHERLAQIAQLGLDTGQLAFNDEGGLTIQAVEVKQRKVRGKKTEQPTTKTVQYTWV